MSFLPTTRSRAADADGNRPGSAGLERAIRHPTTPAGWFGPHLTVIVPEKCITASGDMKIMTNNCRRTSWAFRSIWTRTWAWAWAALALILVTGNNGARADLRSGPLGFHRAYHSASDISAFLVSVATNHSEHARVVKLGTTYESRPIEALYLSLSLPSNGLGLPDTQYSSSDSVADRGQQPLGLPTPRPKPRIIINAGTHAREWVGPAAALYMVDRLVSDLETEAVAGADAEADADANACADTGSTTRRDRRTLRKVLHAFDIVILPLLNPDGYAYSWDHKRLWRRNRQPVAGGCKGIDLNLNFDYQFSGAPEQDGCQEYYPGSAPNEAVETRVLSELIRGTHPALRGPPARMLLDMHAYGQQLMYPFASSCATAVPDEEDLLEAALGAVKEVRSPGNPTLPGSPAVYTSGRVCELLVGTWGNSIDWAYAEAGVKWAFALELRDTGSHGYRLPASRIRAAGEDARRVFLYLAHFVHSVRMELVAGARRSMAAAVCVCVCVCMCVCVPVQKR